MSDYKVFVIHGWGGVPESNWFPWLRDELKNENVEASVPQMPNAMYPVKEEWVKYMHDIIGQPGKDAILVGHSLGVIAILRYLETLKEDKKIGAVILVSGFARSIGIPEIENFFDTPIDFEKIKKVCNKFVVINSDDDQYVPLEIGKDMAEKLDAEFIVMEGAGHIQNPYGKFELPQAYDKIKELIDK